MVRDVKSRLDVALEARGLAPSRARARDLVRQGAVRVNGKVVTKPSQSIAAEAELSLGSEAHDYVSRAALKLKAAVEIFGLGSTFNGARVLDVGASTGGFTEVALELGAGHVVAVDVGRDQLHPRLAADRRVTDLSPLDARELTAAQLVDDASTRTPGIDILVSDVSFISVTKALGPALALAHPGAVKAETAVHDLSPAATSVPFAVILVKPQFEVGRARIGKGGVVRDASAHADAVADVANWLNRVGWDASAVARSPMAGKTGNLEFLLLARPVALTQT